MTWWYINNPYSRHYVECKHVKAYRVCRKCAMRRFVRWSFRGCCNCYVKTATNRGGCESLWICRPIIIHTCSMGKRFCVITVQDKISIFCGWQQRYLVGKRSLVIKYGSTTGSITCLTYNFFLSVCVGLWQECFLWQGVVPILHRPVYTRNNLVSIAKPTSF